MSFISKNNAVVVIEDSIFNDIIFCKSILAKDEFKTSLEKIKFISLSDLSVAIPADRLDDYGVYFYLFEKIDTAEEYIECYNKMRQSVNTENVLLFCQETKHFDINTDELKNKLSKCYNFSIYFDIMSNKKSILPETQSKVERCLNLFVLLSFLLEAESGALENLTVKLKLNHLNIFRAAQCELCSFEKALQKTRGEIASVKEEIEALEERKPLVYSCKAFSKFPEEVEKLSDLEKSASDDELLKKLAIAYADYEDILKKSVGRDVEAVRYIMADVDSTDSDGINPHTTSSRSELIPTAKDLLKKVDSQNKQTGKLNVKEALNMADYLREQAKPKIGSYLKAAGLAAACFIVLAGGVYTTTILKNKSFTSGDVDELLIFTLIPLSIIFVAGIIGFIFNLLKYSKIKKFIDEIFYEVKNLLSELKSRLSAIRAYLDSFITVFLNNHTKDHEIDARKKRILKLQNDQMHITKKASKYTAFAQTALSLYDGEVPEKAKKSISTEEIAEDITNSRDISVHGDRYSQFEYFKSPWITEVDFSFYTNGGIE